MLDIALTTDGWFDGLSNIQSNSIEKLLASGKSEEEIGEIWLSKTGSNNTLGFGAGGSTQSFYSSVKKEFVAFVCGDERYNDQRAEAVRIWNSHGKIGLVTMVSGVIASTLGLAAVTIVPVIALLFSVASRISINSFCSVCSIDKSI